MTPPNALALFHPLTTKLDRLVDLILERLKRDFWIEQPGRTDDLLDNERSAWCMDVKFFWRLIGTRNARLRIGR